MWLLKHRRAGDLAQMRSLADAVISAHANDQPAEWKVEEKQLVFRQPGLVRPMAAGQLLFDSARSDSLEAPWPDVALIAEAATTGIAKVVKTRSGGQTRIVALGRPAGDPGNFDLVLSTPQYDLPDLPNVVRLPLPLASLPLAEPQQMEELQQALSGKARPWLALIVGGNVAPDLLDGATLTKLVAGAAAISAKEGGSLVIITSPRTGVTHEKLLQANLPGNALLLPWTSRPQLYPAVLAAADRFIVTSDSISMTVEAVATGKPVAVYPLPQRHPPGIKLVEALDRRAGLRTERSSARWNPVAHAFRLGMLEAPVNRMRFHKSLESRNAIGIFPNFASEGLALLAEARDMARAAVNGILA